MADLSSGFKTVQIKMRILKSMDTYFRSLCEEQNRRPSEQFELIFRQWLGYVFDYGLLIDKKLRMKFIGICKSKGFDAKIISENLIEEWIKKQESTGERSSGVSGEGEPGGSPSIIRGGRFAGPPSPRQKGKGQKGQEKAG